MLSPILSNGLLGISSQAGALLAAAGQPGFIVGPIAEFLGIIYNALFNFIYAFIQNGTLAFAIILFTILVKMVLIPLSYKQQHSSYKLQKLQPEMAKIRNKYKGKTDQASQQRMAFELQEFQKKNGISMLGGCLPLLIQLPILYALFYIFQQAYLYVDVVGNNYQQIADLILQVPAQTRVDVLTNIVYAKNVAIDVGSQADLMQLISMTTRADWNTILAGFSQIADQLTPLLEQKHGIEYFLGISLISNPGLSFPGIIVPIVAGVSTWVSSMLLMRNQSTSPDDPAAGTMRTMNIIMPIMMGVLAINTPAGLGIYWTVSNLVQMAQQAALTKYFRYKDEKQAREAVK